VALLLRRRGIMKVRPLEGGLDSWRKLGFPMKGTGASPTVLERTQEA
jgi:3-mercaptopyruvate sulfurtransferase SseA